MERYIPINFEEEFPDIEIIEIAETVKYKKVIRKGKKIRKPTTSKKGYKIVYKNGRPKEVKMSSGERIKKSKSARKAARKGKSKRNVAAMKRKRSIKKRTF